MPWPVSCRGRFHAVASLIQSSNARTPVMPPSFSPAKSPVDPAGAAKASAQPSIAVIAPDLAGGGTTRVYLVANALQQLGCAVTVIGPQFAPQLYPQPPQNLTVHAIPAQRSLKYAIALKKLLASLNADILYAIKPRPTSLGTGLLKNLLSRRRPLLLDIDDWEMSWHRHRYRPSLKQLARDVLTPKGALHNPEHLLYLEWMESLIAKADGVTVSTRFLQERFGGHYLPNSKDTDLFDPAHYDADHSREKYGLVGYRVLMFPGFASRARFSTGDCRGAQPRQL